jgi:hypothetical protein
LRWLEGSWRMLDNRGIESWKYENGQLKGQVFDNDKKKYAEALRLYITENGALAYEATVASQNQGKPVNFILQEQKADSFFLFVNMQHDYPNYLRYRRLSDTIVECHVSGIKDNGYTFKMERITQDK